MVRAITSLILLCWTLVFARAEEDCKSHRDCQSGWKCEQGKCIAKDCIARELNDFSAQFDAKTYKEMLLEEAGITENDLFQARLANRDELEFVNSAPAKAFQSTIQAHSHELHEIAQIIMACRSGQADATASSTAPKI